MSINEGREFEGLMDDALPPEPGAIGDPDLGVQLDHDPGEAPEEDDSEAPVEINDDEDEEEI